MSDKELLRRLDWEASDDHRGLPGSKLCGEAAEYIRSLERLVRRYVREELVKRLGEANGFPEFGSAQYNELLADLAALEAASTYAMSDKAELPPAIAEALFEECELREMLPASYQPAVDMLVAAIRTELHRQSERIAALERLIRQKLAEGRCGIEWGEKAEALLRSEGDSQ